MTLYFRLRREPRRSGARWVRSAAIVLGSLVIAAAAAAQVPPPSPDDDVSVYSTTDSLGVDLGPIPLTEPGEWIFDVYVDTGSLVSTSRNACVECTACDETCAACDFCDSMGVSDPDFGLPCIGSPNGGDGSELCGLDIQVNLTGDVQITSFIPDLSLCESTAAIASFPTDFEEINTSLRFNVLCGVTPLSAGIHRLGSLSVNMGDIGPNDSPTVAVTGSIAIGANRQRRTIAVNLLAAPEPGIGLALVLGTAGLVGFGRGRRPRVESE